MALWHTGYRKLTPAQMRRVLRLLRLAQRLKDDGTATIPDHIHQQLRRLRQATGLALSTRLL